MIEVNSIKAILFDSGRVLNRPRTGNWFLPPNFYNYVNKDVFESFPDALLDKAFQRGMDYLQSKNLILSEDEELEHFYHFYKLILLELPEIGLGEFEVQSIAEDTVLNDEKFYFFEDVFEVIPRLRRKFDLGIVSDTWPSLDRVFRNAGLRDYFSTFVMSSVLGVIKPHELMYQTALDELGIRPEEALFIDDSIRNLQGAEKLGIQTILMVRDENIDLSRIEYEYITSLNDLEKLIGES